MSVPEDVLAFLQGHVESHEQLQIVGWLKDRAQLALSADEVASSLGIPIIVADAALLALHHQELVEVTGVEGERRFQFSPRTPQLAAGVERLLETYREDPAGLMKVLIHTAIERLRRDAGALFLDELARRR